jgi:hypothetical protein
MPNVSLKIIASACVLTFAASAGAQAQANCRLGETTQWTAWSGHDNDFHDLLSLPNSDWHGLKRIANFERSNEPCRTEAVFGRMPNATRAAAEVERDSDTCNGNSRDEIEVGFDDRMEGGFISGIRVWTSNQNNVERRRLKGMRARVQMVTEDCDLVGFSWSASSSDVFSDNGVEYTATALSPLTTQETRANADRRHSFANCPDGWIASGVQMAHGARGVSGMRLQCREVLPR